ncbi:MAG: hypothetical protein H6774_01950 [Pseudomonadales bacterium]|nr:hypothetical protein [Pseudomonadales bacterium]
MRKLVLIFILMCVTIIPKAEVYAQSSGCNYVGQCVGGRRCECELVNPTTGNCTLLNPSGSLCDTSITGGVEPPQGITDFQDNNGNIVDIGIINFASLAIRALTIVSGIFIMFNIIRAGWYYLMAWDNTEATGKVKELLTYSVIGLGVIATAYTIAALIGLIMFGDPTFILNPQLSSALSTTTTP